MPYLGQATGILACTSLATGYVGALYLAGSKDRNNAAEIKRRIWTCTTVSVLSLLLVALLLHSEQLPQQQAYWSALGIRGSGLLQATVIPLLLTVILFTGPIMLKIRSPDGLMGDVEWSLPCLRDYIFAPLSEEIVFRACIAAVLRFQAGWSSALITAVGPLFFSLAHAHHVWGMVVHEGHTIGEALGAVAFQVLFTTVFGCFFTHIFLQTGHLAAAVVVHSFCNLMGVPQLQHLGRWGDRRAVWAGFAGGIAAFVVLQGPALDSDLYGGSAYSTRRWGGLY